MKARSCRASVFLATLSFVSCVPKYNACAVLYE
uniref:Lipoprotein n=1 Tax=Rhizophora mucronata TaxID=61149 RepID=A0A2P2LCN8_RHIMU